MALIEREILGDQQRLAHKLQLGQGRRNVGKQLGVVIDWRIALGKVEIIRTARCGARLVEHTAYALACTVKHGVRKHTQATGNMGLPRHRIADGARLQQAELANAGLIGTQLIHQFALGNQELGSRQRRIVRLLDRNTIGLSDVDARTVNMDMRLARTRQQRTGTTRQRAGGQIGPHVEAEDEIRPIALEHTTLAYRLGTTGRFLGRLEHKENVAPNGARLFANRTVNIRRGGKRHGHVSVMSASVHLAGMG